MKYQMEVTDTFAGEANYCWINRETFEDSENLTDLQLVRRLKRFAGWSGLRAKTCALGDCIEVRPAGLCQIGFISWGQE